MINTTYNNNNKKTTFKRLDINKINDDNKARSKLTYIANINEQYDIENKEITIRLNILSDIIGKYDSDYISEQINKIKIRSAELRKEILANKLQMIEIKKTLK